MSVQAIEPAGSLEIGHPVESNFCTRIPKCNVVPLQSGWISQLQQYIPKVLAPKNTEMVLIG